MMQHFLQTHSVFVFVFFSFFFLSHDPESVASLLNDQYFNVLCPSLETLCEVPLTVDVD